MSILVGEQIHIRSVEGQRGAVLEKELLEITSPSFLSSIDRSKGTASIMMHRPARSGKRKSDEVNVRSGISSVIKS
jgi:hypothetical protein